MSERAGGYQRSASGMVGAMIVLLAVVFGFVAFRGLVRDDLERPVSEVDYQETVAFAQESTDFPLLAPDRLPDGWRATSARFVPDPPHWHLGLLTDQERYVGLEQGTSSVRDMVGTYVGEEAVREGRVRIGGRSWQVWTDEGGDTALTRAHGDVTTLVVGTPEREVLVDFVRGLR